MEMKTTRNLFHCLIGLAAIFLSSFFSISRSTGVGLGTGRLVDVDGHAMYLSSAGRGKPTVVLECGLDDGGSSGVWGIVPSGVKRFAQVILYDRAGLGKSAPGPEPRDSMRITRELHSLLQNTGFQGPYILVGHSFGGLHLRCFADQFPEEVAGLVLVDPTPRELMTEPLSDSQIDNLKRIGASPGMIAEAEGGVTASIPEWAGLKPLPDVPLVVLTSTPPGPGASSLDIERHASLEGYHQALAAMSSDVVHIVASEASHYIQLDQPQLVIDAIKLVIDKVAARR
jgi:pimeloyl-ACP methyl ester carboxylesterase